MGTLCIVVQVISVALQCMSNNCARFRQPRKRGEGCAKCFEKCARETLGSFSPRSKNAYHIVGLGIDTIGESLNNAWWQPRDVPAPLECMYFDCSRVREGRSPLMPSCFLLKRLLVSVYMSVFRLLEGAWYVTWSHSLVLGLFLFK